MTETTIPQLLRISVAATATAKQTATVGTTVGSAKTRTPAQCYQKGRFPGLQGTAGNTKGNKPTEWKDVLQSLRDRREPPRTGIGEEALAWGYGMPGAKRPAVLP